MMTIPEIRDQASGSLFIVAAPSGAGKSTLVNALLAQDPTIVLSVSTTTRAPRPGEGARLRHHVPRVARHRLRRGPHRGDGLTQRRHDRDIAAG